MNFGDFAAGFCLGTAFVLGIQLTTMLLVRVSSNFRQKLVESFTASFSEGLNKKLEEL